MRFLWLRYRVNPCLLEKSTFDFVQANIRHRTIGLDSITSHLRYTIVCFYTAKFMLHEDASHHHQITRERDRAHCRQLPGL